MPLLPRSLLCAVAALLVACASGPSRTQQLAQQVAKARPPMARVLSAYVSLPSRGTGCAMRVAEKAPVESKYQKKVATLEARGRPLERERALELLNARACSLGADTLYVTGEERAKSADDQDVFTATVYGFTTPVRVTPSGLGLNLAPKPLDCRIAYFRTQRPPVAYDELAGLHLDTSSQLGPTAPPQTAMAELSRAACHLGADAIVLTEEFYYPNGGGVRLTGAAISFHESQRRAPPPPGTQEL